ncbi:DVU_1555 family C-GCAxxG-C-C protein [Desulfogranum mediterraneum]|uniref:DVU_1555 family C-GCAxxG-C-C protein n=1 Tax=Desulfogranum mediterraneum TaxID=160661 RepID=UPI000423A00C|nr:DV_1555 family C-GCAxxG-C-C protein [Desulfogranum mediterraneum]
MREYDLEILRLAGQGYCCSQMVLQLALEMEGRENAGLIRALAALCHGFPATSGSCGALTGAACLLGYYGGKGGAEQEEDKRLPLMLDELADWFASYCGERRLGTSCSDIVSHGIADSALCGSLISACYGQAMTILVEHGFEPGNPDAR